ncbi:2-succinyl-5-enolpyruvyl-6-hydroxy-3-cyclohexene-1-carboxylic-acid synthase [Knoellia sp. DB2414S]|uniref:2-succinyl-5-enolpyruvyl-6-hydroxy-3-cyclohexene-1-carboxylate synthase n=2 Tax=Knoellia koreensis TaxID=2730921 RepID=A0A849HLK9_9MICO|nr:2-succinyl-5-enolpyruvyl-6-hydroxy-3-cyclohexene-1-carboxylic-acid synthase [Knoellia sp. DB2414S]NNM47563.1 2-succinyl-5-enolpyruvyl-6-hydroxy-3-cyclohexene-1-carboxylic-acid synthase [Knoellia sp. DB2414S]
MVDELVRQGVRHVVVCPGSRSAPFAYAVQAAERAGRLTMHVRVDERSAAFLGLGLAKLTRVPAVVVTTSGTAVANLHPAVLEAHHGVVPLLVLSADRPVELRRTGANQTTVQPGMFGDAARAEFDVEAPTSDDLVGAEAGSWRAVVGSAVAASRGVGSEPGPVHLNVQLREPLVPDADEAGPADTVGKAGTLGGAESLGQQGGSRPSAFPAATGAGDGVQQLDEFDPTIERTLVVVGDLPEPGQFEQAVAWASAHGWPAVAEPFGDHPRPGVIPGGPLVLSDPGWLDAHAPDRVVTVGRLTLSRPVSALLRRPGVIVEAVAAHQWIVNRPKEIRTHPASLLDQRPRRPRDTSWADEWRTVGHRVAAALAEQPPAWPTGTAVAATVLGALPDNAVLFLGSSNGVRDVDYLAGGRTRPLTVVANRGLAGIDGCVSTAAGIALAGDGPAYALMGDLTFLHDANGLLVGPLEHQPDLTIVVVNDDGGGIFTTLEPGAPELAEDFERVFGTPTGTDLAALCAAHHVRHVLAESPDQLTTAVTEQPHGLTVVEVPVDRSTHRTERDRLRAVATKALRQ